MWSIWVMTIYIQDIISYVPHPIKTTLSYHGQQHHYQNRKIYEQQHCWLSHWWKCQNQKCGTQSSQRLDCNFSARLYPIAPIMLLYNHTPLHLQNSVLHVFYMSRFSCCLKHIPMAQLYYSDLSQVSAIWVLHQPLVTLSPDSHNQTITTIGFQSTCFQMQ